MIEFFQNVAEHRFLQYALLAAGLASVACGIVGTYVVTRRITYIAGGIAHSVLGGMGLARYLALVHGWDWLSPLHGAVAAALASAFTIGWVTMRWKEREDTAIGAIWAIGMAVGIIFIALTPGYNEELMSYLFGNILMVSPGDLWMMLGLDVIVLVVTFLFFNQLMAVTYDEDFARARGLNTEAYFLLLLCLTALTVVVLTTVVGVVLVIALLTLPVAVAGHVVRTLRATMIIAVAVSLLTTTGGLALSYGPDLPAGASIIVLAGGLYVAAILVARWRGRARA